MAVILESELAQSQPDLWPVYMPARETWSKPFWESLSQGTLLLQQCNHCNVTCYPPVDVCCTKCGTTMIWFQASGKAKLWSWTTFHHEFYPGYPLSPPYTVMIVELPEGIRMLASLAADVEPAGLRCEMKLMLNSLKLSADVFIPAFRPVS